MSYRPDAPAFTKPALSTETPIIGLSTDSEPTVGVDGGALEAGATWLHEDTGALKYYTGSAWAAVAVEQADGLRLALLFEIRDLLRGDE